MGVMATISLLSEGGDDVSAAKSPKFWKKIYSQGKSPALNFESIAASKKCIAKRVCPQRPHYSE